MSHPGQETLDTQPVSTMFAAAVLSLVGEPIIWLAGQTIVDKCLHQSFMIVNTKHYEYLVGSYRIDPPTISPTPGIRMSADSVTRGSFGSGCM